MECFVEFRDFTRYACLPLVAEILPQLAQRPRQSKRTFIYYYGAVFFGEFGKPAGAPFLGWKKSFEHKPVARQTASYKSWDKCSGAWKDRYFHSGAAAFAGKHEARVGDARSAGVGDEGDVLACLQTFDKRPDSGVLVEFVMALHRRAYVEMFKKHTARASVFGEYEVGILKHANRAHCHVFKVADRCRNYI